MPDYRPIPEARLEEQGRLARYAFDPGAGPEHVAESDENTRRRWDFGVWRGMFEDGDLLAACGHIEFDARLRGTWLPLAGLTAVATRPERRREGVAGAMVEASLSEYRDRGWVLSALRPFAEGYYGRYGYATGFRYAEATLDPATIAVDGPAAGDGRFREVRRADAPTLAPAYRGWLDGVDLATRREERWWRDRVFRTADGEPYCRAWVRDGEVRGYLTYGFEDCAAGRRLRVHEFAPADHAAALALLGFCRDHAPQAEEVLLEGPRQTVRRVTHAVADRDGVEVRLRQGQMVRVVDVPAVLGALAYPGVEAADIVLAVEDGQVGHNDGRFRLRVRDGAATVECLDGAADAGTDAGTGGVGGGDDGGGRDGDVGGSDVDDGAGARDDGGTGAGGGSDDGRGDGGTDRTVPTARLDVGTLSQLVVGGRPVGHARAAGDLTAGEDAADALRALFPERTAYLPESF